MGAYMAQDSSAYASFVYLLWHHVYKIGPRSVAALALNPTRNTSPMERSYHL
jgi:hypothetical protein